MKLAKIIGQWIVVAFLALLAIGSFPSFSCIIAILIGLLVAPIKKWQSLICKYIKGKIKGIVIATLAVLMLITLPSSDIPNDSEIPTDSTSITAVIITESTSTPTTESISTPTTEASSAPTSAPTEATSESTTAPTSASTESASEPTTAPTSAPTEPTSEPTTAPTSAPTEPASEPTTAPTSAPTEPTSEFTTAPTSAPTEPASEPITAPTSAPTEPTSAPTEGITNSNDSDSASNGDPDGDDTNGSIVYRTPTGKRYHIDPDCGGKNSYEVTLNAAKADNLTPCQTCVE